MRSVAGVSLKLGACDLARRMVEDVEVYRVLAEQKEISLSVRGPDSLPLVGDTAKLSQVIHNVVSNAIKFTPRGKGVEIDVAVAGEHAVLTVRDEGIGSRIVAAHGGRIDVESRVGVGRFTAFSGSPAACSWSLEAGSLPTR